MKTTLIPMSLLGGGASAAQLGQLAADPSVNNYVDTGSTVVLTGLLVLMVKSIFIDRAWLPASSVATDAEMLRKIDRILLVLQQDPDAE